MFANANESAQTREQTQTNADFRLSEKGTENAGKRAQTRANADKREPTQNQRNTPPFTHPLYGGPSFLPRGLYLQIFAGRADMGPRFSQNRAGSGSTTKPLRGPHEFHTMKIGISEDKCGNSKKGQNVTNCPPHGSRALSCKNTNLNLCTGQLGANPL